VNTGAATLCLSPLDGEALRVEWRQAHRHCEEKRRSSRRGACFVYCADTPAAAITSPQRPIWPSSFCARAAGVAWSAGTG
jgi:hypothetical protein